MNTYSIPKPTLPPAAYLLGAALFVGLLGLGLVAFSVFLLVDNWIVAACFALVIELGAVSEAIGIIRKNRPAIAGAVISLLVSGSYNLTRIESAGLELAGLHAWALAIGPLSAVLFLALSLSHELQQHAAAVDTWEKARQAWQDAQAEKEARRQERKEARQEKAALEVAKHQVEPRLEPSTPLRGSSIEPSRGSYADFVEVLQANHREWRNAELAERFNVSTRTITDWRKRYQAEHPTPTMELN